MAGLRDFSGFYRTRCHAAPVAPRLSPLSNCNLSLENIVPTEYIIYLAMDYSLDDHKRTVGAALPGGSIELVGKLYSNAAVWYSAKLDASSLDIIRSDPGVELVECDLFKWPF